MSQSINLNIPALAEINSQLERMREMLFFVHQNNLPEFIPVEKVEELFLVNRQTLNKLAKEGKLNKYKISERKNLFKTKEIYALIESNQVKEFSPKKIASNE